MYWNRIFSQLEPAVLEIRFNAFICVKILANILLCALKR